MFNIINRTFHAVGRASVAMIAAFSWFVGGCAPAKPPPKTVSHVDLSRYVGLWYEIARYPAWFEKDCVGVTAQYSMNPNGTIKVVNSARLHTLDGPIKNAVGRARVVDKTTNARLKVTFFWPFEGDYWIIELGEKYEYSVVSDPRRQYLWILSRTPSMDEGQYQSILKSVQDMGYDPAKLTRTAQLQAETARP
jgi:apolipoprotein D and lipocalin family protein